MAKDRMLYMKLCFVVIVFGLSFIICNKHYIKYYCCPIKLENSIFTLAHACA